MKQLLLLTVMTASAGQGTVWAGANVWTSLGPDGGAARSLVVDPNTPSTLYVVTSAGLYKSTDGGASWNVTPPLPPNSGVINYLVIDPRNRSTLYGATRGASSGIPCNDYVFKSADGGASWRALKSGVPCGLPLPPQGDPHVGLSAPLAIDPQDPNIIYSGSYSDVFKSTDGGETWKASNSGLPPHCCIVLSMTIDPQDPGIVYLSTGVGIFKSTDKGESWRGLHLYAGLAVDPTEQQFGILAIDPKNSSTLYGGGFKSTDGGNTWSALGSGLPATPDGRSSIGGLAIDPLNTNILYAATAYGVFRSTDAGASWSAANSGLKTAAITSLAIDPQNTSTVYVSLGTGIYKSTDGAASWRAANSGIRAVPIYSLAVDSENPGTIYANADRGTYIKSTDGGASWSEVNSLYLVAVDPQKPATLYGLSRAGPDGRLGLSRSIDGGAKWTPANTGLPAELCHAIASLAFDPRSSSTIYAAIWSGGCNETRGGGVWKSVDGGTSWAKFDSNPSGGGVHGLAVDPQNPDTLYAWNGKGLFKSSDGGVNWDKLRAGFVSSVKIDPQNPSTLYAVLNDESIVFVTGDKPGLYKSTDGGVSWSPANSGLPMIYLNFLRIDEINSLVIDPHNTGTLYAATGANGVHRSTDGGASWNPVNSGLTSLSVFGLAIDSQNTVYAGTPGGVFAITLASQSQ